MTDWGTGVWADFRRRRSLPCRSHAFDPTSSTKLYGGGTAFAGLWSAFGSVSLTIDRTCARIGGLVPTVCYSRDEVTSVLVGRTAGPGRSLAFETSDVRPIVTFRPRELPVALDVLMLYGWPAPRAW